MSVYDRVTRFPRCCCRGVVLVTFAMALRAQTIVPPHMEHLLVLPDGQSAMFSSDLTPDGSTQAGSDVYQTNASGVVRLTSMPQPASGMVRAFDLSPDGARLAIATDSGVWIFELATGALRMVSNLPYGGPLRFSPDGGTLIFSIVPYTGHLWFPFLYSAPVSGGTPVELGRGAIDGRYPIASDGTIVFTSPGLANAALTTTAVHNVYTMNLDGSHAKELTHLTGGMNAAEASFTRDGTQIVFLNQGVTGTSAVSLTAWVMQRDGSGMRAVPVDASAKSVAFSADGSLEAWSLNGRIHLVNVASGDDRVVLNLRNSEVGGMEFTADNSRLYYFLGEPGAGQASGNGAAGELRNGAALWWVDLGSGSQRQMYAPRTLSPGGIVDPVTLSGTTLTPGGFVTVYGTNLTGDASFGAAELPLAQSMGGVSLLVNGRPAALLAVTPWQVNGQIPMETPPGSTTFEVRFPDGGSAGRLNAAVVTMAPRQLAVSPTRCAFHAGTGIAADTAHPAAAGEVLEMYGYGLGATKPLVPTGAAAPLAPLAAIVNRLSAFVQAGSFGQTADVLWAGLSPQSLGLYQADIRIPPQTPAGVASIFWSTDTSGLTGGCLVTVR
jgi:uncharacterized protein (TIGR03437 family)